jgi:hypothetical protein
MPAADATTPPPVAGPSPVPQAADPFERLHKMSTTAGVGSGDYVAISGAAIAAVLLGVASLTVLFNTPLLMLIPLAGVTVAAVAWVQVGRSNGTLTGRGLVVIGLLLSAGLGLYQGGVMAVAYAGSVSARRQVVQLIRDFGQDIVAERYKEAYARCDDQFHEKVSLPQFEGNWRMYRHNGNLGNLTGLDWNGLMTFETEVISGDRTAGGMVLLQFSGSTEAFRTGMFFRVVDGTWKIDAMPQLFAPPQQPQAGAPTRPRGPAPTGPQVYGPPKPK